MTDQHWVSIDNIVNNKTVYIFRSNNELLISTNGKVERAKWEYIGNKSLLIDKLTESYLSKHGFFDANVLALKVDSTEEYAVFVNENRYDGELNSIERVFDFLKRKYLDPTIKSTIESNLRQVISQTNNSVVNRFVKYETDKGIIEIAPCLSLKGQKAYLNGYPAPDGTYKFGFLWCVHISDGIISKA